MSMIALDGFTDFWPAFQRGSARVRQDAPVGRQKAGGGLAEYRWVRDILRARARRSDFLSAGLFAEPAWDMLLALYGAELAQRRLPVTSLCASAGAPMTTALRWIQALEKEELVFRRRDPLDGRRIFVDLTAKGCEAMRSYFASLPKSVYPFDT